MPSSESLPRIAAVCAAQLVLFALVLRVYLQRKEIGFLFLSLGFGLQAFTAIVSLLSLCDIGREFAAFWERVWLTTMFGPWILALIGWTCLAVSKRAKP